MRTLIAIACLAPITTHAIQVIYPNKTQVIAKNATTQKKKLIPEKPKYMIENWQWVIYEKHKVPVQYRFILEAIRMNECNQPGGYCYRSSVKSLDTACLNPKRATGDGGIFQMNYIHGKIFDQTMIDLCNMRKAIKEKNDKDFVFWRDKLFEDQMLWTQQQLWHILSDPKLSWKDKVYLSAWHHHRNPVRAKNIKYSNRAVQNWQKIAPMEIYK